MPVAIQHDIANDRDAGFSNSGRVIFICIGSQNLKNSAADFITLFSGA